MEEEQLNGLIEEMSFVDAPNTDSKDSISWHAHREAEKLSDRIGIMKDGCLLAVGTVDELKRKVKCDDFEAAFVSIVKEGM